jgi:hypothetical protein
MVGCRVTDLHSFDELFWGAYLRAEFEAGNITSETDVAEMKRQFMEGISE